MVADTDPGIATCETSGPNIPVATGSGVSGPKTFVKENVARGAKWLDEAAPGWERKIDLERLDILYWASCIIGQADLEPDHSFWEWTSEQMIQHGFMYEYIMDIRGMDSEWRSVVQERINTLPQKEAQTSPLASSPS